MTNEQMERLFELDVKLGKCLIVHDEEAQKEALEDLFQDMSDDTLLSLVKGLTREELQEIDADGNSSTFMFENFSGKILCEVETPVKTKSKHGFIVFSWGHTQYKHIAAASIDELIDKACEWAKTLEKAEEV